MSNVDLELLSDYTEKLKFLYGLKSCRSYQVFMQLPNHFQNFALMLENI